MSNQLNSQVKVMVRDLIDNYNILDEVWTVKDYLEYVNNNLDFDTPIELDDDQFEKERAAYARGIKRKAATDLRQAITVFKSMWKEGKRKLLNDIRNCSYCSKND